MPLNDDAADDFASGIEDETTYPDDSSYSGLAHYAGSGSRAEDGPREILEMPVLDALRPVVGGGGYAAMLGPSEIGWAAKEGAAEIGWAAKEGAVEIGSYASEGPTEVGAVAEIGSYASEGPTELGATLAVIQQARDARVPTPPLKAVAPEAQLPDSDETGLCGVILGLAETLDANAFPLLTDFLRRAGAGLEPRLVRVDSEESYKKFRAEASPELSDLAERMVEVEQSLADHTSDPNAHAALTDEIDSLAQVGEEAAVSEASKRVDLYVPKHMEGLVTAWREGDQICVSMALPEVGGKVRICTSMEPMDKALTEISNHAARTGLPPSSVVGVLPAMGCVLGAATVLKDLAQGAKSIAHVPWTTPFVVRLEPKLQPSLAALGMLALACRAGNSQACAEWAALGNLAPYPIKQAMQEAIQLAQVA